MARTARNSKFDTPSAWATLLFNKSGYWVSISKGRAFGYRNGAKEGRWVARMIDDTGAPSILLAWRMMCLMRMRSRC